MKTNLIEIHFALHQNHVTGDVTGTFTSTSDCMLLGIIRRSLKEKNPEGQPVFRFFNKENRLMHESNSLIGAKKYFFQHLMGEKFTYREIHCGVYKNDIHTIQQWLIIISGPPLEDQRSVQTASENNNDQIELLKFSWELRNGPGERDMISLKKLHDLIGKYIINPYTDFEGIFDKEKPMKKIRLAKKTPIYIILLIFFELEEKKILCSPAGFFETICANFLDGNGKPLRNERGNMSSNLSKYRKIHLFETEKYEPTLKKEIKEIIKALKGTVLAE